MADMDEWQKATYGKVIEFVNKGAVFGAESNDLSIAFNLKEAYVIMKAFEDQQRLLNPLVTVEPPEAS